MTDVPKVTAIVLNWNNYQDTRSCLESLQTVDYENLDVLVVDNGSTDGSGKKIEAKFPSVDLLYNEENQGFAGGINPGIRRAIDNESQFVWLLNNDTQFPNSNVLNQLVETMEANSSAGIVTPLVKEFPDTSEVWFWRGLVDWRTANADHADSPAEFQKNLVETEYVPNCCSLIRVEVFEEVGFLPERYFIYYEDVDYGIHVRDAGYRLLTDTRTTVYHEQGGTSGDELEPLFSYYNGRNTLLLARRFRDKLKPSFPVYFPVWVAKQVGYRILNGGYSGILPFFRGVLDGVLGRTGRGPYP